MKLLLDTSYLFPAIGISIEEIPEQASLELQKKGHILFISEISLFELAAKGAKYISEQKLTSERVSRGLRAIVHEKRLSKLPFYDTDILLSAFKTRRILNDFIDCSILSSALTHCEALVTEDPHMQTIASLEDFKEIKRSLNPNFRLYSIKELL